MTRTIASPSPEELLDRQLATLIERGYAMKPYTISLRERVTGIDATTIDLEAGKLPFVVATRGLLPIDEMMSRAERDGRAGVTKLYPWQPNDFQTIETVTLPEEHTYLLVDIDRGKSSINLPPDEALKRIIAAGRSPLTIEEGIAIVTQYPDFLMKNNCFSLAASRHSGDKRVPAIWINKSKQPHLGWCWAGNPHTWLGTASCARRL